MSRNHRKPGIVRVICTDPYHRDSREFARHGFRLVETMRLFPMADGGYMINSVRVSPAAIYPVKPHPGTPAGGFVHIFECTCGRNLQLQQRKLMPHVLALYEAASAPYPGAIRVDLDITTVRH